MRRTHSRLQILVVLAIASGCAKTSTPTPAPKASPGEPAQVEPPAASSPAAEAPPETPARREPPAASSPAVEAPAGTPGQGEPATASAAWSAYVRFTQPIDGLPPECAAEIVIAPRAVAHTGKATEEAKRAHILAQDALAGKAWAEILGSMPKDGAQAIGDHLYVLGLNAIKAGDASVGLAYWECAALRYLQPQAALKLAQLYRAGSSGLGLILVTEVAADPNIAYFWLLAAFTADLLEGEYYRAAENAIGDINAMGRGPRTARDPGMDAALQALFLHAYPGAANLTGWPNIQQ